MKEESKELNYEITQIQAKHLSVIWRKSQRQYNEAWAKQIADNFDPDKFEPISVTKPNGAGVYHIIEGQHRKGAIEIMWGPNEYIPCRVISEADPSRAAEIWLGINGGRKRVRPITEFIVAVEAKRETEVKIYNIVKRHGYRIVENSKGEACITAVGTLRKVYNSYGEVILSKTLQTCRIMWGTEPQGVSGPMLSGVAMFINEFSQADIGHLRKVITEQYKTPWKFVEAVRLESDRSSEPLDISMSEMLRMKYNKKRTEAKRLKHKE